MRTIALVAAVLVSTAALADTTTRYAVLFQDRPGGSQVTTVRADGRIDVDMSYRNNGRGPDIKEHSRFAPDGTLVSFQVTGKSTFGAPISESYALRGNQAQWRSVADHGEATVTAPAVYVPVDSSFEAFAVIVRAALRCGLLLCRCACAIVTGVGGRAAIDQRLEIIASLRWVRFCGFRRRGLEGHACRCF